MNVGENTHSPLLLSLVSCARKWFDVSESGGPSLDKDHVSQFHPGGKVVDAKPDGIVVDKKWEYDKTNGWLYGHVLAFLEFKRPQHEVKDDRKDRSTKRRAIDHSGPTSARFEWLFYNPTQKDSLQLSADGIVCVGQVAQRVTAKIQECVAVYKDKESESPLHNDKFVQWGGASDSFHFFLLKFIGVPPKLTLELNNRYAPLMEMSAPMALRNSKDELDFDGEGMKCLNWLVTKAPSVHWERPDQN